ncbi:MAG: 23S rRNA (pseudouridine(1915)-N(3))-methyltransferase RlmH [Gemmatimonadota bacterium]|nr:23S rRNA (pseudouridine(1915)-N(3))-methyltransferase RlmH [Gemmatimonadota bacterium]
MKIVVAVVGRVRHPGLAAAAADFEARAARYWPIEILEVREQRDVGGLWGTSHIVREGERLLAAVPRGAHIVACDPGGKEMTSEVFSAWLQKMRESATDLAFLIGGARGLSDAVRRAARSRLSLAPWTLPHELARVVLAEQLYRAGTIVRGEPYNK